MPPKKKKALPSVGMEQPFKNIDDHPERDKVMTEFLMNKLSYEEVAEIFGVHRGDVFDYLMMSMKRYALRDTSTAEMPELVILLKSVVGELRNRTIEWLSMPISYDNYKPVTSMIRELRGLIKDISNVEQKLNVVPQHKIESLNDQLDVLMQFVGTSMCDECKVKVADFLLTDFGRDRKYIEAEYEVA